MKKAAQRRAANASGAAHAHANGVSPVVELRLRREAATRLLAAASDRCVKCGSTYIVREPVFIHCRYCGNMARVPTGSLLEQELFELRSGLRLAS